MTDDNDKGKVLSMVAKPTDAERAEHHKQAFLAVMQPVLAAMNDAHKDGFAIISQVDMTPVGFQVVTLKLLKTF